MFELVPQTWATKHQQFRQVPVRTKSGLQEDNATVKRQGIVQNNGSQLLSRSKASAFQVSFALSSDPVCQDSRVRILDVLFWSRALGCAFVVSQLKVMFLKCFLESGHDERRQFSRRCFRDGVSVCPASQLGREPRPRAFSSRLRIPPKPPAEREQMAPRRRPSLTVIGRLPLGVFAQAVGCTLSFSCPQDGEDRSQHRAPSCGSFDGVNVSKRQTPFLMSHAMKTFVGSAAIFAWIFHAREM